MTTKTDLKRLEAQFGALQAVHKGADPKAFEKYRDNPAGFIEEVLGGTLYDAQREIAESVRDFPQVAVKSANAIGKDWLAARLALWFVYARRGLVLLSGPTLRQVREVLMAEVSRAWTDELPGELFTHALRVPGSDNAGILAYTSSEVSKMTGHHADRVLAVLTEAQGVESHGFEALYACAVGESDKFLILGNPLTRSGDFARLFESDVWETFTISALDFPNVTEGKVIIPGGMTRAGVERIEREFGKGSNVYRSRVLGEFPSEDSEALIRRYWLEQSAERFRTGKPSDVAPIIAVDPARYGNDKTACAIRRGNRIEACETWSQRDTMETVDKVVDLAEQVGVLPYQENPPYSFPPHGRIVVDSIGIGSGCLDRLKQLRFDTREFNASRKARKSDKFQNLRAEAFWTLREQLEAGQVDIEWDALLTDELTSLQWAPNAAGKIAMESKDDLRSRIGRSCDRADATVMALAGGIDRKMRVVTHLY